MLGDDTLSSTMRLRQNRQISRRKEKITLSISTLQSDFNRRSLVAVVKISAKRLKSCGVDMMVKVVIVGEIGNKMPPFCRA